MTAVAAPAFEAPGSTRALVMIAAVLGTGMTALDMTIGAVALPHIRGTFSATKDQVGWVLTSYIVATAVMIPASGWLANRFGRKEVYITAMVGFTGASVLCGLAQTLPQEVAFRVLQGLFGAPLVPLSQTMILDTYPTEKHGHAISIWGFGVVLGPILGPTLGGYLTENFGWPWIFYINVPIGLVAIMAAVAGLGRRVSRPRTRLDLPGFFMLAISIAAVQTMLDRGGREDWFESTEIVMYAVIAGLAAYTLAVHTFTTRESFINKEIFRDRNFTVGAILIFAFGFILMPPFVLLPPFLQELRGYPVSTVGLILSPRSIGVMVGMMLSGRLLARTEPRIIMIAGLLLTGWSGWDMASWTGDVGTEAIIWNGVIQGFGMGLIYSPIFTLTFVTLNPVLRGEATGIFQLLRNVGSSVAVAVFLTLLVRNTTISRASLVNNITEYNEALRAAEIAAAWSPTTPQGLAAINAEITRQAELIAYANDFYLLCFVTLAMIPLALLLKRPPRPAR
ncbi:MAG TPA: MDR family MFS transporter [Burkholderiales bacterium]|nr:MDR family MFS transporter [Alphaproteobacteria bacterium]HUX23581.1 MDR family MFS transporter [Burkholderiales bacterium]